MEIKCRKCGKMAEHSVRKDGKPHVWCKGCQREYSRNHYQANKEQHIERRRRNKYGQRVKCREFINQVKDRPCMDCGVKYPPPVMQFDHRDPSTKKFTISQFAGGDANLEAIKEEIAKCDVVCANCHAIRTWC